jgi:hypothetical protein
MRWPSNPARRSRSPSLLKASSAGCARRHLVETDAGSENIDVARAPERARGVWPLAYDLLEQLDERLRVETGRRAKRIVLATGIKLGQAAEQRPPASSANGGTEFAANAPARRCEA